MAKMRGPDRVRAALDAASLECGIRTLPGSTRPRWRPRRRRTARHVTPITTSRTPTPSTTTSRSFLNTASRIAPR